MTNTKDKEAKVDINFARALMGLHASSAPTAPGPDPMDRDNAWFVT